MATIKVIHGDAAAYPTDTQLLFTDPPYEMPGAELARILSVHSANHLLLLTTMSQLVPFLSASEWRLAFDFVIDCVAPKKSRSVRQPNYTHQTGVYMTRNGAHSVFDRKQRQRSDVFEANGYWPTIFHAPRDTSHSHGMAKNPQAITDLLGSFDVQSVSDPFAGGGSVGLAAWELGIPCTLIEKDAAHFDGLVRALRFVGSNLEIARG